MKKQLIASLLAVVMIAGTMLAVSPSPVTVYGEPVVTALPNTVRVEKEYDTSFLSVTGFAEGQVNDRTEYLNTEYHRVVSTEYAFLKALDDARTGAVKIIEVTEDLDLGFTGLSDEAKACSSISEYAQNISVKLNNPGVLINGISQMVISNVEGLTIFSRGGVTIRRAEWKLQGSCKDIVIRNIKFDGMWQWSDAANSKEAGWSLMKVNGAKGVWFDHCSFTLGADGNADLENGAAGVSFTWCTFSLPTTETPFKGDNLYQNVMYMEFLYQSGQANKEGRYYKMREAGATVKEILAYEAFHNKAFLVGSGDKDYKDNEKLGLQDGNQRLRVTYAYNKVTNIGQRFPRVRQGTAHLFNCYLDNMDHMLMHKNNPIFKEYGGWGSNRAVNAQNGASIGLDTCILHGVNEPAICAEIQGPTTLWFKHAVNHVLFANSTVTNTDGDSHTGSSWDNEGENLFNTKFVWRDKSTIGKWAWFSHIVGEEDMERENIPDMEFEFTYEYDTMLPYEYQTVSLEDLKDVINTHAGAYVYNQEPTFWVRTEYAAGERIQPVDMTVDVPVTEISIDREHYKVSLGDALQIFAEAKPAYATEREFTYTSADTSIAEVWDSGLIVPKAVGNTTVTIRSASGVEKECTIEVYQKVTKLTLKSRTKAVYEGEEFVIVHTIKPEDATNQNVIWESSDEEVATVDANGTIRAMKAGKTTITCIAEDDPEMKGSCVVTVKVDPNATPTPAPTATPSPVLLGDVNGNGIINAGDALMVLEHAANIKVLTDAKELEAADIEQDGVINAADALEILNIAAGIK